jgi:hypothetical protein
MDYSHRMQTCSESDTDLDIGTGPLGHARAMHSGATPPGSGHGRTGDPRPPFAESSRAPRRARLRRASGQQFSTYRLGVRPDVGTLPPAHAEERYHGPGTAIGNTGEAGGVGRRDVATRGG